ncbi:MAG TPA: hypothetical protein VJ732_11245 [Bryobacteraceae bacterium]|nr:hypothetical protein [Bryobacteraceae bacterium]
MKKISVQLTLEQLQALVTLADNQLFRVKYIDPKLPGFVKHPEELETSIAAVAALQEALNAAKGIKLKAHL